MPREHKYSKYIGIWITPELYDRLLKEADKIYKPTETNIRGEKFKQPKTYVSTLIREDLEKKYK